MKDTILQNKTEYYGDKTTVNAVLESCRELEDEFRELQSINTPIIQRLSDTL